MQLALPLMAMWALLGINLDRLTTDWTCFGFVGCHVVTPFDRNEQSANTDHHFRRITRKISFASVLRFSKEDEIESQ